MVEPRDRGIGKRGTTAQEDLTPTRGQLARPPEVDDQSARYRQTAHLDSQGRNTQGCEAEAASSLNSSNSLATPPKATTRLRRAHLGVQLCSWQQQRAKSFIDRSPGDVAPLTPHSCSDLATVCSRLAFRPI